MILTAFIVPAKQSGTKSERKQNGAAAVATTTKQSINTYNNTIVATSPEQYDGRLSLSHTLSIYLCV